MHAATQVKIDVTADDIVSGQANCIGLCAIALAVKRVTGLTLVYVYKTKVVLLESSEYANLPAAARRFIVAIDAGKTPAPLSFKLRFKYDLKLASGIDKPALQPSVSVDELRACLHLAKFSTVQ